MVYLEDIDKKPGDPREGNLLEAVTRCHFRHVRFLLKSGANVNTTNHRGENALMKCCYISDPNRRINMMSILRKYGIDLQAKDISGKSVLSHICHSGLTHMVAFILSHTFCELDLNDRDSEGNTCLMYGVKSGQTSTVRLLMRSLLKYGLSVDVEDNQGMTPYMEAMRLGFREISDMLLKEGYAVPFRMDNTWHRSPREWFDVQRQIDDEKLKDEKMRNGMIWPSKEDAHRLRIDGAVHGGSSSDNSFDERRRERRGVRPRERRAVSYPRDSVISWKIDGIGESGNTLRRLELLSLASHQNKFIEQHMGSVETSQDTSAKSSNKLAPVGGPVNMSGPSMGIWDRLDDMMTQKSTQKCRSYRVPARLPPVEQKIRKLDKSRRKSKFVINPVKSARKNGRRESMKPGAITPSTREPSMLNDPRHSGMVK